MRVICFGDSNTYGYDPRGYFGGRYDSNHRWVDLLAQQTNWDILNAGMNGLEIPYHADSATFDADLFIVMLGTNDLLHGYRADQVTVRMESFLNEMLDRKHRKQSILLIAPPPMQLGEWVPSQTLIDDSMKLREQYSCLAQRLGISFADAGLWGISMAFDGVHFTEEGHRAFADGLYQTLTRSIPCVQHRYQPTH